MVPVRSPHTSYRWRERVIETIKWMGIIRRPWLTRASGGNLARTGWPKDFLEKAVHFHCCVTKMAELAFFFYTVAIFWSDTTPWILIASWYSPYWQNAWFVSELFLKKSLFLFYLRSKYSFIFVKLLLNLRCHLDYFIDVYTFLTLRTFHLSCYVCRDSELLDFIKIS